MSHQQNQKHEEPSQRKTTIAAKRTFLRKGEGIARFGMKPKIITKPTTVNEKNCGNNLMEQKAPVTRKTATAKDYASISKRSAIPALTEDAGVKQKSTVNHFATLKPSDRLQLDARNSKMSKPVTVQQTAGTILTYNLLL